MKTSIKSILPVVLLCLFSLACTKTPTAAFESDKSEYMAGDKVILTNTSTDAAKYQWTLPDSQTSDLESLSFTLPGNLPNDTYPVTLKAISKNGKKSTETTKSLTVKAGKGRIVVWNSSKLIDTITVSLDGGIGVRRAVSYFATFPNCDMPGCVLFENVSTGPHAVTVKFKGSTITGNVTVFRDECAQYNVR